MDDEGPQSLCVVVYWASQAPYSSSIIQLDTPQVDTHEYAASAKTPIQTEFSAHFPRLSWARPLSWVRRLISLRISLPPASSTEDLYMLSDWSFINQTAETDEAGTLPGFTFNLVTKKCKIIKTPLAPKCMGHAVTVGDRIYFMAQPEWEHQLPRFEHYDTLSQEWVELEPLPLHTTSGNRLAGFIQGTAVLNDTILFYIDGRSGPSMQAYKVSTNKWYPVEVLDNLCYNIVGEAVVLKNIIYALAWHCESVVTLQLKSQKKDGVLVFTCNLHKEYKVPGITQVEFPDFLESYWWTRHLVDLGKDNFCVVQSCNHGGVVKNQYIQLTSIKLSEKEKSIVTNICVHEFKLPSYGQFIIEHCFFVPKCKTTTALKEHEAEIVTLPPELLQFQDKYWSQRKIIDEQGGSVSKSSQSIDDADTKTPQVQEDVPKKSVVAAESNVPCKASTGTGHQSLNDATKASSPGDGHFIYVTGLPRDAIYSQLVKRLKRFGLIKSVAIKVYLHDMCDGCLVDVEFESASSKQNAIQASPIAIGGCVAVIEKKIGTPLTRGGGSVSQSTLGYRHPIFVTNLPLDANCSQLAKRLKRFGFIRSVAIKTYLINNMGEWCFGDVEFESATSKQNAIKESIITIGGHIAVIEEKRGTGGLTQGDSNRSSSKTSRNNKKKRGKDSPKTPIWKE